MKRRFGLVALIRAMLTGLAQRPENMDNRDLLERRADLLTNGGRAPLPQRTYNQRQKRKRNRQNNRYD